MSIKRRETLTASALKALSERQRKPTGSDRSMINTGEAQR